MQVLTGKIENFEPLRFVIVCMGSKTPWAGKNWETMFIPRIGQEVIVNFLEGDLDHPIIIGRVFVQEVTVISNKYSLSVEEPPMADIFLTFKTIKWEFRDNTGDSFCAGLDVKSNEILDCQHIL